MMAVRVAFATPEKQLEIPLTVPDNFLVGMVIAWSGIACHFPEVDFSQIAVGIYGRKVLLHDPVAAGDRIELYRPLKMDPKEARRLRALKKSQS